MVPGIVVDTPAAVRYRSAGITTRLLSVRYIIAMLMCYRLQDQDSLLVKRRNDNHSPGPVIRELVPSSHQRSELSNTILCIFSR